MSVQSCLTLWDLIVALQAPLSMGLSHQEYCSGLPFPPPDPFNLCSKPMRCMLIFSGDLFAIQRSQMIPNIINPGKGQFVLSPVIKSLYLRAPISWLCEWVCAHSVTQSCPTLCSPLDNCLPGACLWNFPGKNTGMDHHFLFQRFFLTQGSKSCLLHLLHRQMDSLLLHHLGNPISWLT